MENNVQKMREALLKLRAEIGRFYNNEWIPYDAWQGCDDLISHALTAPPRQCDVGTAEEQIGRFRDFCQAEMCGRYRCRGGSKSICIDRCAIAWAQTPYEAEEGGAE